MRRNTSSKREGRGGGEKREPFTFASAKRARLRMYDDEKCYDVFHRGLFYDLCELNRLRTDRRSSQQGFVIRDLHAIRSEGRTILNLHSIVIKLSQNFAQNLILKIIVQNFFNGR